VLERTHRHYRDRLGGTLASDDIRLPFVGVDGRAGEPLEGGEPAEMGAVAVRQHDVLEVLDRTADAPYAVENLTGVGVEEGVYESQVCTVIEEEGVYVTPLILLHAVDTGGYLRHDPVFFHGAKAFFTPRSAGARAG
jgi:hypothetical protein